MIMQGSDTVSRRVKMQVFLCSDIEIFTIKTIMVIKMVTRIVLIQ